VSSETTGQHSVPETQGGVLDAMRAALWKQAIAIVLSGVGLLGATGAAFYVDVQADRARDEEIHERLEHDVRELESEQRAAAEAADDLSGDLRALKAIVEQGHADQRARLARIEALLDAQRGRPR
jgi:hypothetical protein